MITQVMNHGPRMVSWHHMKRDHSPGTVTLVLLLSALGRIPTSQLHQFLIGLPIHLIGKKEMSIVLFS